MYKAAGWWQVVENKLASDQQLTWAKVSLFFCYWKKTNLIKLHG